METRTGSNELESLGSHRFVELLRYGEYLLINLDDRHAPIINTMLTDPFRWVEAGEKKLSRLAVVFGFEDGHELRDSDIRRMGRFYLTDTDHLEIVPQFSNMWPDMLTNQGLVADIGNTYSDEILREAKLHPRRKRSTMDDHDILRLFKVNSYSDRALFDGCGCDHSERGSWPQKGMARASERPPRGGQVMSRSGTPIKW